MVAATQAAIAIVGIGCRFPGEVDSPISMWELLAGGKDAISEVPGDRWSVDALFDADATRRGKISTREAGFIHEVDRFDAELFGISAREAAHMDPQQRLLLEVAWAALEDSGRDPRAFAGSDAAVFVGLMLQDYLAIQTSVDNRELIDGQTVVGMGGCMAANRISHAFDLRGPSVVLDTACSSSLVAVHLACQSIRSGDASLALIGGVNLMLRPEPTIAASQARMLAPDGRCKGFDARANGYARGEGAGVVVLRPLAKALAEGDRIYAVIAGTAVNQDGGTRRVTLPSGRAQQEVVRKACERAGCSPGELQYLEGHGTGTPVGDPIEMQALAEVLGVGREGPACVLGSIKSNIGHTEAAAGVAGLIKAALALHHRQIPPHLHFQSAPKGLDLVKLGLRIPTSLEPWPEPKRRRLAGVNTFGLGGTNAHVILEGAPPHQRDTQRDTQGGASTSELAELVVVSARTRPELERACARLALFVRAEPDPGLSLADLSLSSMRRAQLSHRGACVARSREHLAELLERGELLEGEATDPRPRVVFVFGGSGQHWPELGRRLLDEVPEFRAAILACERALRAWVGWSLSEELQRPAADARLDQVEIGQPVLFAFQVALAAVWRAWGVEPELLIGHSAGEVAAAHVAGALDLDDAVRLIHHRSRLQAQCAGEGAMLAVHLGTARAEAMIKARPQLCVAAVNSPESLTLAGPRPELVALATELDELGVFNRFVPGEIAFHSPAMDPLIPELLASLSGLNARTPRRSWWSSVTGQAVDAAPGPEYWARNLREPVRFGAAVEGVCATEPAVFLELGAHPVLASSLRECLAARGREAAVLASVRRDHGGREPLLRALARLHVLGVPTRLEASCAAGARLTSLPSYPFAGQRHWIESPRARELRLGHAPTPAPLERDSARPATEASDADLDTRMRELVARVFQIAPAQLDLGQPLARLGLDSVMALELAHELERSFATRVPIGQILAGPSTTALTALVRDGGSKLPAASWLLRLSSPSNPRLRLICIPFAGAMASVFRPWVELLPEVELWAVRLPGGLERERERPFEQMQPLVHALLDQLDGVLDPPFALYGHSLGALVALAVARELQARGRPGPSHVCVAAHPSPNVEGPGLRMSLPKSAAEFDARLSDPAFLRSIGYLEELADFAGEQALMQALRPALGAAFQIARAYRPPPEPTLACPLFAYVGAEDRVADEAQMRGWAAYTDGSFRLREFAGGHLFLRGAAAELTRALREDLALDPALDAAGGS